MFETNIKYLPSVGQSILQLLHGKSEQKIALCNNSYNILHTVSIPMCVTYHTYAVAQYHSLVYNWSTRISLFLFIYFIIIFYIFAFPANKIHLCATFYSLHIKAHLSYCILQDVYKRQTFICSWWRHKLNENYQVPRLT